MGALPRKKQTVAELRDKVSDVQVAVVLDYRGLTVAQINQLRAELSKTNATLTVAKNTLMKRAVEGDALAAIEPLLKGPTALVVGNADQVAPVKTLQDYLKKNKKENEIRGGYLEGKALSAKEVDELAKLPPLDELRAKLLGGIASPMNGLVAALIGPHRALANVLDQVASQKQQAS
ncbi:MAG: 50S ribosomal protein L10 [Vampirovibrionales bacterium]|nr:50S ribosomal protein L10 [Vampirovibrionales bacterium]